MSWRPKRTADKRASRIIHHVRDELSARNRQNVERLNRKHKRRATDKRARQARKASR